jgi:hypothetical protein
MAMSSMVSAISRNKRDSVGRRAALASFELVALSID